MEQTELQLIIARLKLHWRQCRSGEMPRANQGDYADLFRNLEADVATQALHRALMEKPDFMPTEARILANAADIAYPLPNSGDLWAEFNRAVGTSRPRWSHPYMERIVRRLGGWSLFARVYWGYADVDEASIWFPRFQNAYEACALDWRVEVAEELRKPSEKRDPKFLPALPKPVALIERAACETGEPYKAIPMPEFVRNQLKMVEDNVRMPSTISQSSSRMSKEALKAAQDEVMAHRIARGLE